MLEELNKSCLCADDIADLSTDQLLERYSSESTAPKGFLVTIIEQSLVKYKLEITQMQAQVTASVTIDCDLTFTACVCGNTCIIPGSRFKDNVSGPLKKMSQLLNVVARVKSWREESQPLPADVHIENATSSLHAAEPTSKRRRIEKLKSTALVN
jgi:hypothetical protein